MSIENIYDKANRMLLLIDALDTLAQKKGYVFMCVQDMKRMILHEVGDEGHINLRVGILWSRKPPDTRWGPDDWWVEIPYKDILAFDRTDCAIMPNSTRYRVEQWRSEWQAIKDVDLNHALTIMKQWQALEDEIDLLPELIQKQFYERLGD